MTFRALALTAALLALAPTSGAQPTGDAPVARRPTPAPSTGATPVPRSPAATGATAAQRPAARPANTAPPSTESVRVPIAALEASVFGACAQNDLAITRVSGGVTAPRMRVERQMREGGIVVQRYVYRASGCGRTPRRHNVEIYAREGLPSAAFALPMGATVATRLIMQGVYTQIFTPMLRERAPDCAPTELKILDTSLARGTPFTAGQTWTENWRFDACGARGTAELTFAYDGDGVRMTANVPAITPAPASAGATSSPAP